MDGLKNIHQIREIGKMINSIKKGRSAERELANKLKEYGYDTKRAQQYCGANGDADVLGLPNIHIECKRVEKLNVSNAIAQAKADRKSGLPAVFHRKNREKWLVTMELGDWMKIYESQAHDEFIEKMRKDLI